MNVLFLAPHPFYQERGTPIAVNLLLRVLSLRGENVDFVTFHEGQDLHYDNVTMHRIVSLPFVKGLRPGFSGKKLVCDALLFFTAIHLVIKNPYDVVHAVEESVFMAMMIKWAFRIPYVYDMDSSLAQQMVEKHSWLTKIERFLNRCERIAISQARAVVPVCHALGLIARKCAQPNVLVLHDIPLETGNPYHSVLQLKADLHIPGPMVMYVGNLETYQGIDLLLDSFAMVIAHRPPVHLVIVGGDQRDIDRYQKKGRELGIQENVHFLGTRPVEELSVYLSEADVLVSPRIKGNNTPMKIYSYLQSGVPVVATDLPMHTQVMNSEVAEMVKPTPQGMAAGILKILEDPAKGGKLGKSAKSLIEQHYSYKAFRRKIDILYDWIKADALTPLHVETELVRTTDHQPTS